MTQTLIEKLEALPRYAHDYGGMICTEVPIETCVWLNIHDLRAIIEQAKAECEPVGYVSEGSLQSIESGRDGVVGAKSNLRVHPLYTAPQPTPQAEQVGWIRAVDEEMVSTFLGVAERNDSYEVAKKKLHDLIQWHIAVATDPAVNGGYKLVKEDEPTPQDVIDAERYRFCRENREYWIYTDEAIDQAMKGQP